MGKELGAISHCSGFMLPLNHSECYFCFSPFSIKAKILCGFLLHSKNRCSCRSFLKAKCMKWTFKSLCSIHTTLMYLLYLVGLVLVLFFSNFKIKTTTNLLSSPAAAAAAAAKSLQSCLSLCDPWNAAYQAPPSMGFSRQEYWSGVPLPFPISSIDRNKFRIIYSSQK